MEREPTHYREILTQEFEQRCKRNAAYSMRAYARDLGLSVASLSKVLVGKQGLSLQKAKLIAKAIQLSASETELFCTLVESKHARAKVARTQAVNKLGEEKLQVANLSLEYFKTIADWHHFAIMALTEVSDFKNDPKWIAKRIGITPTEATQAIERMLKLELVHEDSARGLIKSEDHWATPTGIPSRSLKNHHQQILKKAETALFEQPVQERDFSTVAFAMNKEDLDWAKEELKNFRRKLTRRLRQREDKDRLYLLSMQLFALDQLSKGEKS